jgi:hypothetical protein
LRALVEVEEILVEASLTEDMIADSLCSKAKVLAAKFTSEGDSLVIRR